MTNSTCFAIIKSMPGVKYRFAKVEDYNKCKKFDSRVDKEIFSKMVSKKEVLVSTYDKEIIGYIRLEYIWLKIPYLSWIKVNESWRRQGIAAGMLNKISTYLKQKDHTFLISSFQKNAPKSRKWHNSVGFEKCGKIDGINEDGSSELFCKLVY